MSKNKVNESTPRFYVRIIGGFALILVTLPFLYPQLTEIMFYCQFENDPICKIELNKLLTMLTIVVPLVLAGSWLIFSSIMRMYPSQSKE